MSLGFTLVIFVCAVVMVVLFYGVRGEAGRSAAEFGDLALAKNASWVGDVGTAQPGVRGYLDIRYSVGVDGLSVWLVVLAALLTPLSIWASFNRSW